MSLSPRNAVILNTWTNDKDQAAVFYRPAYRAAPHREEQQKLLVQRSHMYVETKAILQL